MTNDFDDADKYVKKIRKAKKLTEYKAAVETLLSRCSFSVE